MTNKQQVIELLIGSAGMEQVSFDCAEDVADKIDAIYSEQYAELVEAAVAYRDSVITDSCSEEFKTLRRAIQPFLPPPSIADRLDALAIGTTEGQRVKLRAIAKELREGEK